MRFLPARALGSSFSVAERRRVAVGAALCALLLLGPGQARADDGEQEVARLTAEAATAYGAGAFERAVQLLDRAYGLRPHAVLLYNLGRAYEKLGDVHGICSAFRRYLASADAEPKLEKKVRLRLAQCAREEASPEPAPVALPAPPPVAATPAPVVIVEPPPAPPPQTVLKVEPVPPPVPPIPAQKDPEVPVDEPGLHTDRSATPPPPELSNHGSANDPVSGPVLGPAPVAGAAPAEPQFRRAWLVAGGVVLALAAGAFIGGVVEYAEAAGARQSETAERSVDVKRSIVADGQTEALASTVLYAVSGVLAVGSIPLFVNGASRGGRREAGPKLSLSPWLSPTVAGAGVSCRF